MFNSFVPNGVMQVQHRAMVPPGGFQAPTPNTNTLGQPAIINPLEMPQDKKPSVFRTVTVTSGFFAPITDPGWIAALQAEFSKDYFRNLALKLQNDYTNKQIYPPQELIFNAFNLTPLDQVKVVIIGQDPYLQAGQAMGLSFSVPMGIDVPPSLRNIFIELANDENINGFTTPNHGCLINWAQQGVFLLNTFLTVEEGQRLSHSKYGWQMFTDEVIRIINQCCYGVVFMLFGRKAEKKEALIDTKRHFVIKTGHPSPQNTHGGFFGSNCFSEANNLLSAPIVWLF